MVAEKRPPALTRRSAALNHIFGDSGLSDLEAELQKLAVNARRTPQGGVSRATDLNGETRMARMNQRSPITRPAYAIRSSPQRDEVFGTDQRALGPLPVATSFRRAACTKATGNLPREIGSSRGRQRPFTAHRTCQRIYRLRSGAFARARSAARSLAQAARLDSVYRLPGTNANIILDAAST